MILHARGARMRGPAIVLFVVQFILNLVWSPLFFAAHQVTSALYLAGAIAGLTLITLILFAMIRKVAALLMLPYLLWLCFAVYLTLEIDRLNPDAETLRSEENTSEFQSLMRISYAVFCWKQKRNTHTHVHLTSKTSI